MFETTHNHGTPGAPDATLRESHSGFSGFGGRPSLHPAWRDDEDVRQTIGPATAAVQASSR